MGGGGPTAEEEDLAVPSPNFSEDFMNPCARHLSVTDRRRDDVGIPADSCVRSFVDMSCGTRYYQSPAYVICKAKSERCEGCGAWLRMDGKCEYCGKPVYAEFRGNAYRC